MVTVDTAVFVYARGQEHHWRDPCRRLVGALGDGVLRVSASVEVVQEYAHVILRRSGDRALAVREARAVAALVDLHAVEVADLRLALSLMETSSLGVRDAVHAACALGLGADAIVTTDRAFDGITGLVRLDPSAAVRTLLPT